MNDPADLPSAPPHDADEPAQPAASGSPPRRRGPLAEIPTRTLVAATLVAAVIALAVGALIVLATDDGDGPEVIGEGTPDVFQLVPDDDPDILGAPAAVDYLTFDDEPRNTGPLVGRPLVLNFFAEWCPPCIAEMPDFEAVYQEVGEEVGFLGLSYLESAELGRSVVERTGVTYEVGRDPDGDAYEVFGGIQMPTTVFIDEAGTVLEVHNGVLTESQLRDRIDRHFGLSAP